MKPVHRRLALAFLLGCHASARRPSKAPEPATGVAVGVPWQVVLNDVARELGRHGGREQVHSSLTTWSFQTRQASATRQPPSPGCAPCLGARVVLTGVLRSDNHGQRFEAPASMTLEVDVSFAVEAAYPGPTMSWKAAVQEVRDLQVDGVDSTADVDSLGVVALRATGEGPERLAAPWLALRPTAVLAVLSSDDGGEEVPDLPVSLTAHHVLFGRGAVPPGAKSQVFTRIPMGTWLAERNRHFENGPGLRGSVTRKLLRATGVSQGADGAWQVELLGPPVRNGRERSRRTGTVSLRPQLSVDPSGRLSVEVAVDPTTWNPPLEDGARGWSLAEHEPVVQSLEHAVAATVREAWPGPRGITRTPLPVQPAELRLGPHDLWATWTVTPR